MADVKYRHAHQQERKAWVPRVRAGGVCCWRCGRPIVAIPGVKGEGWQLGHRAGQPSHPECARCNMRAGGRIGAAITNARRHRRRRAPLTTRAW